MWASWQNQRSFWPLRSDRLYAMKDAGFCVILEQYDTLAGNIREAMRTGEHGGLYRSTFIGIK